MYGSADGKLNRSILARGFTLSYRIPVVTRLLSNGANKLSMACVNVKDWLLAIKFNNKSKRSKAVLRNLLSFLIKNRWFVI